MGTEGPAATSSHGKGGLSPLVTGARQMSETVTRIQDRLREEIPRKPEPIPVNVQELWAVAAEKEPRPSTMSEETDTCTETPSDGSADSDATEGASPGTTKDDDR